MSERTPEQIMAVGQAKMRKDTAARRVVEKQFKATEVDLAMVRAMAHVVGEERGLRQIVDLDGKPLPNKFFGISEADGVLTVRAIEEVQQDLEDQIFGIGTMSDNEYLDFSDQDFEEVREFLRIR